MNILMKGSSSHIACKRVRVDYKKYRSLRLQAEETMKKILPRYSGCLATTLAALRMNLFLI